MDRGWRCDGLEEFLDALAQGGIPGAGLVKIGGALPRGQPSCGAKDGHFAIRRISHGQISYSTIQCEKPERKAQKKWRTPVTDCGAEGARHGTREWQRCRGR